MADLLSSPALECGFAAQPYPHLWTWGIFEQGTPFVLPSGTLRIGGDSPDGLVLVDNSPASRVVRLYDMETGELVSQTYSAGDGTYALSGLVSRTQGYAVWIVGGIGENGLIIQDVDPG